ncbi:MAG: hypothetical protein ACHP65_02095 [Legionellales bacterium]
MINFNSFRWGCLVVVPLVLSLSGCYLDEQRIQNADHAPQPEKIIVTNKNQPKVIKAEQQGNAREPIQQVAPGPKRAAAPQLPVIQ